MKTLRALMLLALATQTYVTQGGEADAFTGADKLIKSEGIDHKVKANLAFAVSGTADVDDLRVWSLDK